MAQATVWRDYETPEATSARGWLHAITGPFKLEDRHTYNHNTMPVFDDDLNAWREQSTLGNYLDYGPVRPGREADYPDGMVHAVSYAAHTSRYHRTVVEAKAWIESEAKRVRPDLEILRSERGSK